MKVDEIMGISFKDFMQMTHGGKMLTVINHQEIWIKAMSYHHTPNREVTRMIKKSFFLKKSKNCQQYHGREFNLQNLDLKKKNLGTRASESAQ